MDKKSLRNQVREKLKSLNRITYEHHSYIIAKKLMETPEWNAATTIGLTVSHFPEVDTWQLIRTGWEQGKRIVVPRCNPEEKSMIFRKITAFNQLESVYFGLFEPNHQTERAHKSDIDLVVVPGIAFSRNGYRLGFGGGYYDRFLTEFKGDCLSLAFFNQVLENLPIEYHDVPVRKIITEQEIIVCQ